jgi:SAM-dependent methyltransferase
MSDGILYDRIGAGYSLGRRTDSRWMSVVVRALGDARVVLNVGAGPGSYEPSAGTVFAVEPSAEMLRQRPATAAQAVRGVAEALPVRDRSVDAALAVLTVHHWTDWQVGIAELRRVAPLRVVLAYDTEAHCDYWFVREYVPEIAERERSRPSAPHIADELGADSVTPLLVPWDFTDGVFPAYWRRPEAYLDPAVRRSCSALAQADPGVVDRGVRRLAEDLRSGHWHERHRDLLELDHFDAGFRLIVSRA